MYFRSFLLGVILSLFVNLSLAQSSLWGNLNRGPYEIGFASYSKYDRTRPAIREQKVLPPEQQVGRPIQINIWYPSESKGEPKMTIQEYFRLTTKAIDFNANVSSLDSLIDIVAQEQMNSHGIEMNKQGLMEYLRVNQFTEASIIADPAAGTFPLIVIGPEAAFKWCIMAEFLASHGYVVVMTPKTGSTERLPDFERTLFEKASFMKSSEASKRDLEFAMAFAKELPYVDKTKMGSLGYSGNVTSGIGLITRGIEFDAIISLEGAIGGYIGPEVLSMTPFYSPYKIKQPMLHIFNPVFSPGDYWIKQYKYCNRTLIPTADIRHDHLTTYGMLEKFVTNVSGATKIAPHFFLETAYLYSLKFLNDHLKNSKKAKDFFENIEHHVETSGFQNGVDADWRGVRKFPAVNTYDEYELRSIYEIAGFEEIAKIYNGLSPENPQPFSKSTYFNFGLFLKKVPEKEKWYSFYVSSYPDFSEPYFLLGQEKQRQDQKEEAIRNYRKALALFEETDHILLEDIFSRIINRRLEKLSE